MTNRARSFFELISSPKFKKPGKQNETLFNRLKSALGTDDENIISTYIHNSRIALQELEHDVNVSGIGDEALKRYLSVIVRFYQFFTLNRPFAQMQDSALDEFENGFLYLSEQKEIFSFEFSSIEMRNLAQSIDEADELLNEFPADDHRIRIIERNLSAVKHFLKQADSQSFDACWTELSSLVMYLYREELSESNPKKKKLFKELAKWGTVTVAALAAATSALENGEKLIGYAEKVLPISFSDGEKS